MVIGRFSMGLPMSSSPSSTAEPEVGSMKPAMMSNKVDLPDPLYPNMATISAGLHSRLYV